MDLQASDLRAGAVELASAARAADVLHDPAVRWVQGRVVTADASTIADIVEGDVLAPVRLRAAQRREQDLGALIERIEAFIAKARGTAGASDPAGPRPPPRRDAT